MAVTITDVTGLNLAEYQGKGCLGVTIGDRVIETDGTNDELFSDGLDWKIGSNSRHVKCYIIGQYQTLRIYGSGGGGVDSGDSYTLPLIFTNAGGKCLVTGRDDINTGLSINGFKNIRVTGKYDPFLGTGHVNYQGHKDSTLGYTYNENYGIETLSISMGADTLNGSDDQFNDITIDHVDVNSKIDGFAGIFIKSDGRPDPANYVSTLRIHDCYLHNSYLGENVYIGNSTGSSEHTIRLFYFNNRSANASAECTQQNRLAAGSQVFNNISINGGIDFLNAFEAFQDSNQQLGSAEGDIEYEGNIVLGARGNNLNFSINASDDPDILTSGNLGRRYVRINNNLFGDIGNYLAFFNSETKAYSTQIEFTRNYIRNKDFIKDRLNDGNTEASFLISGNTSNLVNDKLVFVDNILDYTTLLDPGLADDSNVFEEGNLTSQTVDPPSFVNSGFNDATMNYLHLEMYEHLKGSVAGDEENDPIVFDSGKWVIRKEDHTTWLALQEVDQSVTGKMEPSIDTGWESYWSQVTWDGRDQQPADYRLISDDDYNKLGMGLLDNQEPDTNTVIKWEWAYDDNSSPYTDQIEHIAYNKDEAWITKHIEALDLTDKWIRKGIKVRNNQGSEDTEFRYTSWIQLV